MTLANCLHGSKQKTFCATRSVLHRMCQSFDAPLHACVFLSGSAHVNAKIISEQRVLQLNPLPRSFPGSPQVLLTLKCTCIAQVSTFHFENLQSVFSDDPLMTKSEKQMLQAAHKNRRKQTTTTNNNKTRKHGGCSNSSFARAGRHFSH